MIENLKRYWAPTLFSLGFAMFLGISIPKVGGVFLIFAPAQNDLVWKIASYGAAFTIDVLAGWLVFATTAKHRRRFIQAMIWTFILSLSSYSIFLNWVYDELHTPGMTLSAVWSLPMFAGWNLGQLTSLLVSAIPAGILGFALIARLIREESQPLSLDELRTLAAESVERTDLEKQLFTASMGKQTARITGLIAAGKEVASSLVKREQPAQVTPKEEGETNPPSKEQPAQIEEGNLPSFTPSLDPEISADDDLLNEMLTHYPMAASWLSTSVKSVTVEEVCRVTRLSEKVIRNRMAKKTINRTPNNPDRVLKNSLLDWWTSSWQDELKKQQTAPLRVVTLVPSEDQSNGKNHHQDGVV